MEVDSNLQLRNLSYLWVLFSLSLSPSVARFSFKVP